MDSEKKIFEKSPLSGIAVPIAIVLVSALIVWGITKMLSTGRDYKDLVEELHSKTFGNRWVAAYELSKYIAAEKIPQEDVPWLIDNLKTVYSETVDERTRNFIVLALGSLKNEKSIDLLFEALSSADSKVQFSALIGLGNMPQNLREKYLWTKIIELLSVNDVGLQQVAVVILAQNKIIQAKDKIIDLAKNGSDQGLIYTSSMALLYFGDLENLDQVEEVLKLDYKINKNNFNEAQIESLKLNALSALTAFFQDKNLFNQRLMNLVEYVASNDSNISVSTRARELLIRLKK